MSRHLDLILTALAPAIWGSSYLITTELLPEGYPLTVAMLRALPAGLLLLLIVRKLPEGMIWWGRVFLLGVLNFGFFWWMLFEAAYRLPGGVAATVGAIQPLFVIFLASAVLSEKLRIISVFAALTGIGGVAFMVLSGEAKFDMIGILAAALGAASMAFGTVLTRKWQPPVSLLTFTSWQLVAGGLILLPFSMILEPALPVLTVKNYAGFIYLGLIGAAFTYILWFRGISKIEPTKISVLGFFSPAAAVLLGWGILGQNLTILQIVGLAFVIFSVWLGQQSGFRFNFKNKLTV
ncbi:EamA family transporter [Curvivirga aplysinae]|uniref:EamA family transporter n=1 Tax=Curvivirga aplysinae TaxID=2529852 RepID=UPI0012BB6477|nr:EamA family transporter [Curvivirga aplysinae]MTI09267.1 EamA family transporter [Curvivirga aplysinae]